MPIQISDSIFTQIMTVMGAPFVTIAPTGSDPKGYDLELTVDQIKDYILQPALLDYYRWFPIESYATMSVSGPFEFPFPSQYVFSAKDVRMTTNLMNYGPTGNALVDERFIQSSGGLYGRGMYGTRNDYGMATARISRRVEMQSFIDKNKTFKWRVIENQRKITGFSNVAGTMEIVWASWSDSWDYVAFSQQQDVIKLCQGKVLEYFGHLRLQDSVSDAPVELNGQALIDHGKELIDAVYEKWTNFTVPIVMRGKGDTMKLLNEKYTSEQVSELAKKIYDYTDENDHTAAGKALATFLKNKKAEKAYDGISALQDFFGHTPQELGKIRSMITDSILQYLKNQVSDEDYKKIYKSF